MFSRGRGDMVGAIWWGRSERDREKKRTKWKQKRTCKSAGEVLGSKKRFTKDGMEIPLWDNKTASNHSLNTYANITNDAS
jgi:hypothetical protein